MSKHKGNFRNLYFSIQISQYSVLFIYCFIYFFNDLLLIIFLVAFLFYIGIRISYSK